MSSSIGDILSQHAVDKREAQMLLAHVLGVSRASIIAYAERQLDATQAQTANRLLRVAPTVSRLHI